MFSDLPDSIQQFVDFCHQDDGSGHDLDHLQRVAQMAHKLSQDEMHIDRELIHMACWLHDTIDVKLTDQTEQRVQKIRELLSSLSWSSLRIDHLIDVIQRVSFKGAGVDTSMPSLEGKIVQDADRLDALGAIGVARCFAFGGNRSRPLYVPDQKVVFHQSEAEYRSEQKNAQGSLNHFDEKLLLLTERMQTPMGKRWARKRHRLLETFKRQFIEEWFSEDFPE